MTVSVNSSLPRTNFRGIKDETAVDLTIAAERLPIRLPLFFSYASWGEENKARYVDSQALELLYGNEVLNPRSPFFTHQSQFLRTHLQGGGKAQFLRVVPDNAKQSSFRLAIDMVADEIQLYERNPDGTFKLDANGDKIEDTGTIPGHRVRLKLVPIPEVAGVTTFGQGVAMPGALVASVGGAISTLTPIFDGLARFRGKKGDNIGLRLIAPTVNSIDPADADMQEALGSFLYRMQIVTRANSNSTATTKRTLSGDNYLNVSFKKGTVDLETNVEYYAGKVVVPAYETADMSAFTGFGPFERVSVYDAALQGILDTLAEREADYTGEAISDSHLINFLTGVDVNGVPYHTIVVEGPSLGGLLFNESSNHFMAGGSDGTMSAAAYNTQIDGLLSDLTGSQIPFHDIARMPYDSVWDSGFPVDTKKKFANFHSLRPDVYIHACTQDVSRPVNSASEDSSIGVTLRSHFRAVQESSEFGTKALRFAVAANAGYLINDNYDGVVPFLEYLCYLGARYMGGENGEMNSNYAFGRGEQNIITRYRDHNAGGKQGPDRNTDWQNGLNFADWFDMNRLFWAGVQSIHEDHTSILHGYLNVQIACNLTRIGHIVWRELSGDSQLTDDEFLDEVEARVVAKTTGRYDGRVTITPDAYYSAHDEASGFGWHLNIGMAGDGIRTVENLAIIAQRRRNEE